MYACDATRRNAAGAHASVQLMDTRQDYERRHVEVQMAEHELRRELQVVKRKLTQTSAAYRSLRQQLQDTTAKLDKWREEERQAWLKRATRAKAKYDAQVVVKERDAQAASAALATPTQLATQPGPPMGRGRGRVQAPEHVVATQVGHEAQPVPGSGRGKQMVLPAWAVAQQNAAVSGQHTAQPTPGSGRGKQMVIPAWKVMQHNVTASGQHTATAQSMREHAWQREREQAHLQAKTADDHKQQCDHECELAMEAVSTCHAKWLVELQANDMQHRCPRCGQAGAKSESSCGCEWRWAQAHGPRAPRAPFLAKGTTATVLVAAVHLRLITSIESI
eukprot:COSAG02_NODE_7436_length_3014_cov_2.413722_2_plen_334_part_00